MLFHVEFLITPDRRADHRTRDTPEMADDKTDSTMKFHRNNIHDDGCKEYYSWLEVCVEIRYRQKRSATAQKILKKGEVYTVRMFQGQSLKDTFSFEARVTGGKVWWMFYKLLPKSPETPALRRLMVI
eukprot:scaffold1559_cov114-Cylindrotheca_fusiformis.AAC.11